MQFYWKLALAMVLSIAFASNVFANEIEEGHRYLSECNRFTNLDQFPDYYFVATDIEVSGDPRVLKNGKCFGFVYTGSIHAIKKDDVSRSEIVDLNFETDPRVITAEKIINSANSQVPEDDPRKGWEVDYKVDELSDDNFMIYEEKITTIYHEEGLGWFRMMIIGGIWVVFGFFYFLIRRV